MMSKSGPSSSRPKDLKRLKRKDGKSNVSTKSSKFYLKRVRATTISKTGTKGTQRKLKLKKLNNQHLLILRW
jgi:hypothetical protein